MLSFPEKGRLKPQGAQVYEDLPTMVDFVIDKVKNRRPNRTGILPKGDNFLPKTLIADLAPKFIDFIGCPVPKFEHEFLISFKIDIDFVRIKTGNFDTVLMEEKGATGTAVEYSPELFLIEAHTIFDPVFDLFLQRLRFLDNNISLDDSRTHIFGLDCMRI